jgi:hypothetical protein
MPRFYFDTNIHGKVHRDPDGEVYADASAAVHEAKAGAAEYLADIIARSGTPDHEKKLVRAESGEIVARFLITDPLRANIACAR